MTIEIHAVYLAFKVRRHFGAEQNMPAVVGGHMGGVMAWNCQADEKTQSFVLVSQEYKVQNPVRI